MNTEDFSIFKHHPRIRHALLLSVLILLSTYLHNASADPPPFNLPATLNDSNTKLSFKVDSTWHLIEGEVKGITGSARLSEQNDPLSVTGTVSFPLSRFSTDRESRDERLREVMASTEFPQVTFEVVEFHPSCGLELLKRDTECSGTLVGNLTIRKTSQKITLPTIFSKKGGVYSVQGTYPITWADYGVEDPSILVAQLDPIVIVAFSVDLK